jgi:hypothetical protein
MKTKNARRRLADERAGGALDQHGDRRQMRGKPGLTVRPTLLSGVHRPRTPALGGASRRPTSKVQCGALSTRGFSDATGEALDVLVLERHDGRRGQANCGREIVLTDEEARIIEYPPGVY